jgi:hypothetical protein
MFLVPTINTFSISLNLGCATSCANTLSIITPPIPPPRVVPVPSPPQPPQIPRRHHLPPPSCLPTATYSPPHQRAAASRNPLPSPPVRRCVHKMREREGEKGHRPIPAHRRLPRGPPTRHAGGHRRGSPPRRGSRCLHAAAEPAAACYLELWDRVQAPSTAWGGVGPLSVMQGPAANGAEQLTR